jgi:glycosyltransferase involved in cell wall biosynthesis
VRILQLCSGRELNGAIGHCFDLARRLSERGHHVVIGHRSKAQLGSMAAEHGLPTLKLSMGRWPVSRLWQELAAIRGGQFDLIHTHQSRAHLFGVIAKFALGIPTVATAHSRFFQPHWMLNSHVIAPTRATAEFHRRFNRVPVHKLSVVHNWISDDHARTVSPDQRARLQSELGLSPGERVVLVVGNVEPRKGLDVLVRAMPQVLAQDPQTRVIAVGKQEKEFASRVMDEARQLGVEASIRMLGPRRDIPELLSLADVFCLPSREEQLPLSVLEAMAAGKPVVATRVGGLPECIASGLHGILVPSKDSAALGSAISELLRSPATCARMSLAAQRRIASAFAPPSCIGQIEVIYARVLSPRRIQGVSVPA